MKWGMDLATFTAPQIKHILKFASLDGDVFEALVLVKRMGTDAREGRRRQFDYIGVLYEVNNGSDTKLLYSVSDPLLIRDGSETEYNNSVFDPLLIKDGSETEYNNSQRKHISVADSITGDDFRDGIDFVSVPLQN
ncbi:hypothetical protein Syun_016720 [Stephania yunnanensis]|uniref:Uncharacterized protein n=1 Tax=Stephania yunnanensis TaxID=152371 RepID=A0AAP0J7V8_9MAGN